MPELTNSTSQGPRPAGPTARWTPLRYHAEQMRAWTCGAQFVALPCGRRSGKTEIAKRLLVRWLPLQIPGCLHPRYVFGGPTSDQAKMIAWQDLLDLIPDRWIVGGKHGPNVMLSTLTVQTRFGSSLRVVGLDKPHRIEGAHINGIVLDESSDLRPKTFDRAILPMLADYRGWAWRIGVPKRQGIGAPEYRTFCEQCARGEYPGGAVFTWPSSDILSAGAVAHARDTLDPKDFREQFEASWETSGGGVFHSFDRQYNVRPCAYDSKKPILVGSDFNVDPMAWALGHRYENRLEWFDEIWIRNTNTQAALNMLAGRYDGHAGGWEFYGDASGGARKTCATTTDLVQIGSDERFKLMGRTLHYRRANPPVEDRFAAVNAMLCNAAGDRRMFIDPRCKRLIEDLEHRAYKPGTRDVADSADLGHMTDAMSYVVFMLFPIRFKTDGLAAVITSDSRGLR